MWTGREGLPYRGDVALEGEHVAAVGPRIDGPADQEIPGGGLAAAPGFIDIHTHTDATIFAHPLAESKAMQGVTVEVIGNCGLGAFPVNPDRRNTLADYLKMHDFEFPKEGLDWKNFNQYATRLEQLGLGVNVAALVGHGALRIAVMGAESRDPTSAELIAMEELLAEALNEGVWGMSAGLIYPPGSYAKTEELIALAKVLARWGALYTTHIRGESGTLMQALDEAIRIGKESGARVEVSHLKAMGKGNWGRGRELLEKLEAARRAGVDIAADQYPYEATSTSLSALIPEWAHAGGVNALLQRLSSPDLVPRLEEEIIREMTVRGGPEKIMITSLSSGSRNLGFSGKTVARIAGNWGCIPEQAVIRLLIEEQAAAGAVFFSLSEEDVAAILASDKVSVGSDGRGRNAADDSGEATHPRSYGTFARILGLHVRQKRLLPLEKAVYKMTALPAGRLGLTGRGLLRSGFAADLVLFDPSAVEDRADFNDPQYAAGIVHVWVNGRPIIHGGKFTGERPGRVLRKKYSRPC